jgi:Rhs element Vgr protein
MSSPNRIVTAATKDVATSTVKIDGAAIPRTIRIAGLVVFKAIGKIPFARIEIHDGDPAAQTFEASSGELFVPGNEVEILAGYRSEEIPIFKGIVVGQQLRVRTPGPSILTVFCRHPLFKATLSRRSRTFGNESDDAAIESIFAEYGVSLTNSAPSLPVQESLVQFQCTDWDLALGRAEANGLLLIPTDDGAELLPPPATGEPVLSLLFGATVVELDAEMDARTQPSESTGLAWDPAAQEAVSSTGGEPTLPQAGNLDGTTLADAHGQPDHVAHPAAISQEELDAFTAGRLTLRRLARISGRVRCEGTPDPLPGGFIELGGLGDRFSGHLLISAVRHAFFSGAWHTDIQFGHPCKPLLETGEDASQPPAAGMLPAIHGLAIGVVTAMHNDPASELRVQVSVPSLGDTAAPVWARLAQFDAGDSHGAFFLPEVGNEVVLGFLAGDPRHPVVLGSLYSSGHVAPLDPAEPNPEKGYVSREGLKLFFNDEAKSILIETPNGKAVELSDEAGIIRIEDEHGNKFVLDSSGVTIESASDLNLKSGKDAKVNAGANLDLEAAAQLAVSASASLEVSASGTTTIKGALVQIN